MTQIKKYTLTARVLHWGMAVVWVSGWITGYVAVYWRELLNTHHEITVTHKAVTSLLLFLVVMRIFWRLTHRPPELPASMSSFMQRAAHVAHALIYLLALILLPLSGWAWSSVADKPVMVLWFSQLPPLVSPAPEFYVLARQVHVTLAWLAGVMVSGHILMAVKHRFIDRDGIMESMM